MLKAFNERRDMLAFVACAALVAGAAALTVWAWPDASAHDRLLIVAIWAYNIGTMRGRR